MILVHRPLYNLIVVVSAIKHFPEFLGYKAASYPGQPPPRPVRYGPRRLDLPPGFEHDWKKIKTKRKIIIVVEENTGSQNFVHDQKRMSLGQLTPIEC